MAPPTSVPEVRRFLGMSNQLGKVTPHLAELSQPLRELPVKSRSWYWGPAQSKAFKSIKIELCKPVTLALYDPSAPTKISANASAYGLGAVLLQSHPSGWRAVAFAMSQTERNYAQIEKEALATTWACEKFSDFILGNHIQIETDHKPLVPLLGTKTLDRLPPRILRFRLRLDRFSFEIRHVPVIHSRYPAPQLTPHQSSSECELEALCQLCVLDTVSHLQ